MLSGEHELRSRDIKPPIADPIRTLESFVSTPRIIKQPDTIFVSAGDRLRKAVLDYMRPEIVRSRCDPIVGHKAPLADSHSSAPNFFCGRMTEAISMQEGFVQWVARLRQDPET
ncbi:hypothetical protein XI03_27140 [Bradyrhizobium sp. CCBAU 65884]|nr:hypothetical protein [Bradyrhizobium sp. CCBAU 65884]